MCFSTKKLVIKRAERNKVFYKVLAPINNTFTNYLTPYREMEVKLGKWYTSDSAIVNFCNTNMTLGEGVFHLFKNRKAAESLLKRCYRYIIVKAIVPEGAFYAISKYGEVITSEVKYEKLASKKTFKFWKR